jgi:hypothetical protein
MEVSMPGMLRVLQAGLCLLPLALAVACGSKDAGGSGVKVERTCKDAAGRYGDHLGNDLMADPKNPVPKELHDKAKAAIKEAVIKSCEEDKWDELPLDCLALIFEKPDVVPEKDRGKALDVCAGGAGKDKTAKMDERLGEAMAELGKQARGEKGGPPASSAPPAASGSAK